MTNIITLDTETTGATNDTKGNPFTASNRLCYIGLLSGDGYSDYDIEYSRGPYGQTLGVVSDIFARHQLFVGFNIKFDLHWLRRYGLTLPEMGKIWDCQIFEYMDSKQKTTWPSLDQATTFRNIGRKLDIVRTEYWDKGIDSDKVPEPILREYLNSDVMLTHQLYLEQQKVYDTWPRETQILFSLMCQDLLTLEEMEWNGAYYDHAQSTKRVEELTQEREELVAHLYKLCGLPFLNWGSGYHISAFLFGGVIKEDYREQFEFTYKSGETLLKERWATKEHILPALAMPLQGTKLKKEGYYQTDEGVLRKLKADKKTRKIIDLLLRKKQVEKLMSTYYIGIPKLMQEMEWEDGCIHGGLNQVVTDTGRLASSKPNQQNWPDEFRQCIISRFLI